jgi:alkylated DNA repair dioxygenase AlkB
VGHQLGLFTSGAPGFDDAFAALRRVPLDHGAWIEHAPAWVSGHDTLFEELAAATRWRSERRVMYDREVDVPRLVAGIPTDCPRHPLLESMRAALSRRHGEELVRVTLALYRDGRDSVAPHGDTTARDMDEALVATVSLGAPRRFLLRPAAGGGASVPFELGGGDLFVMGGTCQRTWRHSIPKTARPVGPRIAVMFRPVWQAKPPRGPKEPRPPR